MSAIQKVAVILGSTRTGAFAPKVGQLIADCLKKRNIDVTTIDPNKNRALAVVELPYHHQKEKNAELQAVHESILAQDALIIVTGEYNFGPNPALLALLDNFHHETWGGKVVGIASYGGQTTGGARAVYALRNVAAELGMIAAPSTFSIAQIFQSWNEDGSLKDFDKKEVFLNKFLDETLDIATAMKAHRAAK